MAMGTFRKIKERFCIGAPMNEFQVTPLQVHYRNIKSLEIRTNGQLAAGRLGERLEER